MIFDGYKFRLSKTVVILPMEMWTGEHNNYAAFGKVVPTGSPIPKNAVETGYVRRNSETKVYAVPIPCEGHSLTNLMYGALRNGRRTLYLAYDGKVYTALGRKQVAA